MTDPRSAGLPAALATGALLALVAPAAQALPLTFEGRILGANVVIGDVDYDDVTLTYIFTADTDDLFTGSFGDDSVPLLSVAVDVDGIRSDALPLPPGALELGFYPGLGFFYIVLDGETFAMWGDELAPPDYDFSTEVAWTEATARSLIEPMEVEVQWPLHFPTLDVTGFGWNVFGELLDPDNTDFPHRVSTGAMQLSLGDTGAVPVPAALPLAAAGSVALVLVARRRRRSA
ncbi:hypothetical protein P2H44_05895 [Albimonas sp. CAU 1670]|uniref:hypothetical protein n=1 Tax=Albimonas sp. CAU 1670 TaxID=3032599 RepID=UPI0023D9A666|nr:hypothetical protein [Albimonas sp. CAU 1670]MDF2232080.1 hypothetical protein [Albimonas sp. CAU 1670]